MHADPNHNQNIANVMSPLSFDSFNKAPVSPAILSGANGTNLIGNEDELMEGERDMEQAYAKMNIKYDKSKKK